ncbi:MAG TPA: DNA primase [Syntrophales bacterium]|nr:DNA primase [Syntrophales bacterium]
MNRSIPPEIVEEVKNRTDILSLVSEYVTLRKAGRNYVGLCPFHKEKTPSFSVNQDKQIFYCFGCGEGGNALTFLMKINSMAFPEAVRQLARKAGVRIPEKPLSKEDRERFSQREQLFRLNEIVAGFYEKNLLSAGGERARTYIRDRGIDPKIGKAFRLGYAPEGWKALYEYLSKQGVPLKLAEQAGLILPRSDGSSYYDRFRGRLMFPIEDVQGHIVAFGGRVMGDGEPKYMNSPESPVYVKGKNLYGLGKARDEIRGRGFAVLVEGYFDFLSLWNAGIRNVVASLGTALTREHVDLLRRFTGQITAVFDPDEAGRKALARSLELFIAGNLEARVVVLPDGLDPDAFVRKRGKEGFESILARADSMVDYYIDSVLKSEGSIVGDRRAFREAAAFIVRFDDAVVRDLFVRRVAERLGVEETLLKKEVQKGRFEGNTPGKSPAAAPEKGAPSDTLELKIVRMMLQYPDRIPETAESEILQYLREEDTGTVAKAVLDSMRSAGKLDVASLVDGFRRPDDRRKLMQWIMEKEPPLEEQVIDRMFADAIQQLRKRWYRDRHRELKMRLGKAERAGDHETCHSLLTEIQRLSSEETSLRA